MPTLSKFYKTIEDLVPTRKSWITNEGDALRVASYDLYYDIYWNSPDALAVKMRGDNSIPIHIPSGRIICNTINRYIAPDFAAVADPALGSDSDKEAMTTFYTALFRRERFYSRFLANKLNGVVKGDMLWYLTADPSKPEGSRISITPLDPSVYFEIEDPNDPDAIVGCQIIEEIQAGEDAALKVQTYLKPGATDPKSGLTNESDEFIASTTEYWKQEGFGTEDDQEKPETLPGEEKSLTVVEGITRLPVYRVSNLEEVDNSWGSSEMRGLETLIAGINQSISDEDLTMALQGIGMYWTDGGPPVDENNNPTEWDLGPGRVAEVGQGRTFARVQGVNTVVPFQEHIRMLEDRAQRVNGASDVAQGLVDVSVAESGVALALRMGPIIQAATAKETWLLDVHNQMFYDLNEWAAVYEGQNFNGATMICTVGDKLPQNKQQIFDNLMTLYQASPPLISGKTLREELAKIGYEIPADDLDTIVEEQIKFNEAADMYNTRTGDEVNGASDEFAEEPPVDDGTL